MKTEIEKNIWEKFKSLYHEFPDGRIYDDHESPDYIIEAKKKKIGVEITQVFQDSYKGHSKFKQLSSDGSLFTNQLIDLIDPFVSFKFIIDLSFNNSNHIKKSNKEGLLKKLQLLCIDRLKFLLNKQTVVIDDYSILPKEIDEIWLTRFDNLDSSFNSQSEGGTVSDMYNYHINPILSKKDEKLKNYIECDEYWLIIGEGDYYAGTFMDVKLEKPVTSEFNKVFLLRRNTSELLKIK